MGALEDDLDANLRELRRRNFNSHTMKDPKAAWDDFVCTVCERHGGVDLSFNCCGVLLPAEDRPLTIDFLFQRCLSRGERWHPNGLQDWSALEWAGAMCGEAGEAANKAKKLKRVESEMLNITTDGDSSGQARLVMNADLYRNAVADECADTILYALMLMNRVGVKDPAAVICDVFNKKSEEYGFPERV